MIVKLLIEHHLEFLSLKRGCRGSSEPTLVKMSNCWKSHSAAHIITYLCHFSVQWGQALVFCADKKIPSQGPNFQWNMRLAFCGISSGFSPSVYQLVYPFTGIQEYDCIHYTDAIHIIITLYAMGLHLFLYNMSSYDGVIIS